MSKDWRALWAQAVEDTTPLPEVVVVESEEWPEDEGWLLWQDRKEEERIDALLRQERQAEADRQVVCRLVAAASIGWHGGL